MDKKDIIIIILAIILVSATIVTAFSMGLFGERTKEYDFEVFTMEVSEDREFNRSLDEATGMVSFRSNTTDGNFIKASYYNKVGLIGLLAPAAIDSILRGEQPIDVGDKLTFSEPNTSIAFYELEEGDITYYVCIIETDNVILIINSENLDDLIKMVNTIKLKDISDFTIDNNSVTPTDSSNNQKSTSESKNLEEDEGYEIYSPQQDGYVKVQGQAYDEEADKWYHYDSNGMRYY